MLALLLALLLLAATLADFAWDQLIRMAGLG
jgi:hypothetical protein